MNIARVVLFPLTILCIALKFALTEAPKKPVNSNISSAPTSSTATSETSTIEQHIPKMFDLVPVLMLWEDHYAKVVEEANDLKNIDLKCLEEDEIEPKSWQNFLSTAEIFPKTADKLKTAFCSALSTLSKFTNTPIDREEKNVAKWEKCLEDVQILQFQKKREIEISIQRKRELSDKEDLTKETAKLKQLKENLRNGKIRLVNQIDEGLKIVEDVLAMIPGLIKQLDFISRGVGLIRNRIPK